MIGQEKGLLSLTLYLLSQNTRDFLQVLNFIWRCYFRLAGHMAC